MSTVELIHYVASAYACLSTVAGAKSVSCPPSTCMFLCRPKGYTSALLLYFSVVIYNSVTLPVLQITLCLRRPAAALPSSCQSIYHSACLPSVLKATLSASQLHLRSEPTRS